MLEEEVDQGLGLEVFLYVLGCFLKADNLADNLVYVRLPISGLGEGTNHLYVFDI